MEYRPLKLTVVSAEGLKNVNLFSKMDVYAEVSLAGFPASKQRTPVDKESGKTPMWNHRMEFVVDEPYLTKPGLSLLFKLKSKCFFVDRLIGSVIVGVDDLFRGSSSGEEQFVNYQVRTKSGRAKGSLKFSSYPTMQSGDPMTAYPPMAYPNKPNNEPVSAYPNKPNNEPVSAYPPAYPPPASKKHSDEPVTAYPAAAPVPQGYPGMAYPPAGYPAQSSGYGYQAPQSSGYGYQAPAPQGYGGYGYSQAMPPKKNKFGGGGMGLGLGAGLLGGLLVGDMISDMGDMGDMDY